MTLVLSILGCVAIGWFVPAWLVPRLPGRGAILIASLAALGLGFAFVYAAAFAAGAVRGTDPQLEFEAGFNAWKLLLFLAPAASLHQRRRATRRDE